MLERSSFAGTAGMVNRPDPCPSPAWLAGRRKGGRVAARLTRRRVEARRERLRPYLEWMAAGWSGRTLAATLAPVLAVSERTVRRDLQALPKNMGRSGRTPGPSGSASRP